MKKIILMIVLAFVINVEANDGLFWAAKTDGTQVIEIYRGTTPTTGAAQWVGTPVKYLKVVGGAVVEMTASEKHLVDVPAQYKNADGSEMTTEQKTAVDVALRDARQASKPVMQKTLENMYITYLTNQWTGVLREGGLIGANDVVNVENTDALQNMQYLMYFRAIGSNAIYDYNSNEFSRFKNSLKDYYGADLADCKWHPEIVDIKGVIKKEIQKNLHTAWPKKYQEQQKKLAKENSWQNKMKKINRILLETLGEKTSN
jgi:hypothetical protein